MALMLLLAGWLQLVCPVCAEAEIWLDAVMPEIEVAEAGKLWQGLPVYSVEPSYEVGTTLEGSLYAPDKLDVRPSDESSGWVDMLPVLSTGRMPVNIWIDVYSGPTGSGYAVNIAVVYDKLKFNYVRNVGPESKRSHTWVTDGVVK